MRRVTRRYVVDYFMQTADHSAPELKAMKTIDFYNTCLDLGIFLNCD